MKLALNSGEKQQHEPVCADVPTDTEDRRGGTLPLVRLRGLP